ncbi:hypothetical protein B0H19DRAFT_1117106 [Mycena capillaripes]|nr:hypothetical protein B0H19DRAFT_1117106 [Mycena capillaripes]
MTICRYCISDGMKSNEEGVKRGRKSGRQRREHSNCDGRTRRCDCRSRGNGRAGRSDCRTGRDGRA